MLERQPDQISKLRLSAAIALVVCYLVPLVIITLYNTSLLPLGEAWGVLSLGFVSAMTGSAFLFVLLRRWEGAVVDEMREAPAFVTTGMTSEEIPEEAESSSLAEVQRLLEELGQGQKQRDALCEELHSVQRSLEAVKREKEQLELLCQQQEHSLTAQQTTLGDEIKGKETLLEEYQQTIIDQRTVIEKKQQQIVTLEGEIRDLRYELKTLVDLSDRVIEEQETLSPPQRPVEPSSKVVKIRPDKNDAPTALELGLGLASRTLEEAQQQLKRCIDIAQKLTGARHLAGDSSRFRDLSADGYALDFRRLCDSLGSEQSCAIILYSQKENKVLFVNNQVRCLLYTSPSPRD